MAAAERISSSVLVLRCGVAQAQSRIAASTSSAGVDWFDMIRLSLLFGFGENAGTDSSLQAMLEFAARRKEESMTRLVRHMIVAFALASSCCPAWGASDRVSLIVGGIDKIIYLPVKLAERMG